MSEKNNSTVKNSLWNLVGGGAPIIIGFLSIPFAIKGLGKDGFGILTIGWIVLGYFGLFDLGFGQATTKFSSVHLSNGDEKKFSAVFWVSFLTSLAMGFIGTIILVLLTPLLVDKLLNIPATLIHDARLTFIILGIALPFIISTTSLKGIVAASNRFDIINKIQMPSNILTYIIPGLSYVTGYHLSTVILFIVIMRLMVFFTYLYFCFHLHPYVKNNRVFDKSVFKSMLSFGGWISVSNLLSPLLVYIDRFLIGSLLSIGFVSYYTAPYELIIRTRLFPNSIMDTLFPKFSAFSAAGDTDVLAHLFSQSLKYITLIMGLISVFFIMSSYQILNIWLGKDFANVSSTLLQVLAAGVFFNGIATVPFFLLQGIGRPDIPAKLHALELFIFGIMFYFMIKHFGLIGAAITWSLRAFADCIMLFFITYRINKGLFLKKEFKIYSVALIIIIVYGLLAVVIHLLVFNLKLNILLGVAVIASMMFMLWKLIINDLEKQKISFQIKKVYNKLSIRS